PVKTGRRVTHVEMRWWSKDAGGKASVARELEFSKVGRKERTGAKPRPAWLDKAGEALRTETYETARLRFPGYDVYFIEAEWRAWAAGKGAPKDADRAFLAFFKTYAERNPL
ncbi:MAG: replication protein RepB, partial [Pseudomonadota bacterium]